MATGMPLDVRDYRPGDELAITALYEKVFGRPMGETESLAHWRWDFLSNPVPPVAIKLAWDGDRLVSQCAVSPLRMCVDGREALGCLSHDTMTDPDYQGRGLFAATAGALQDDLALQGFALVYGFPNANSTPSYEKRLGWKKLMPTPVLVKPVRADTLVRGRTGSRLLGLAADLALRAATAPMAALGRQAARDIEIRDETAFGTWADDLWRRCEAQHGIWTVRDRAYLDWRYLARPESRYAIRTAWKDASPVGLIVTTDRARDEGRVRFVMDVLADRSVPGALDALLNSVEAGARTEGIDFLSAIVVPASWQRRTFLRHLYVPLPGRLFPKELNLGGRPLSGQVPAARIFDPRAWALSWGDQDVL